MTAPIVGAVAAPALRGGGLRAATEPPEARGHARDTVRLLASGADGDRLARVRDLPALLRPGDLLVANRSAALPAALPAHAPAEAWTRSVDRPEEGRFLLHLAQAYGGGLWLAEPRWDAATPGPLPLREGARLRVAGLAATLLEPYPALPRLRFVRVHGDVAAASAREGAPIRYGYLRSRPGMEAYATVFGDRPGSAEMASAGRPFTRRLLRALEERGVRIVRVTLHAGVSGLEAPPDDAALVVPAERFEVDADAAAAVNAARTEGRRVVAIGTGAVRALESAWDGRRVAPRAGWTARVLRPGTSGRFLDGLLTGLHGPDASHLRLLDAVIGPARVRRAYAAAARAGLLAHEFGDLQLLWRDDQGDA